MSPAPKLQKKGEDISTPLSFTESYPATWASEVFEPATSNAVGSVTKFSTRHADYTVITTNGVATAIPIATSASGASVTSSGSSNHLALAVALPISLVVACAFVALYLHRFKSRREQERRRATWSQRLNWIPDSKAGRDDVDASTSQAFDAPTPLSPIQTVPASYPGHSRQDSAFA